jgi:hypothetical protein
MILEAKARILNVATNERSATPLPNAERRCMGEQFDPEAYIVLLIVRTDGLAHRLHDYELQRDSG